VYNLRNIFSREDARDMFRMELAQEVESVYIWSLYTLTLSL